MKRFAGLAFLKPWALSSLLLWSLFSSAQDIAVGTWRTHFSYSSARIIEETSDKVFCASENGLFSIDLQDNSIRKLSKIDGLSDMGISAMKYDPFNKVLVIGYRSGLVDFVFEDAIKTIDGIFNSNLEGDKQINDIAFDSERTYLATGLGVIVINTIRSEIVENYVQIGEGGSEVIILEMSLLDNQIFAQTNEGIQSGFTSNNLLDFNNWVHYPTTSSLSYITQAEGQYYAVNESELFRFSNSLWDNTDILLPNSSSKIFSINGQIYTVGNGTIYQLIDNTFEPQINTEATSINDLTFVGNEFLLADEEKGLISQNGEELSPDGPISDDFLNVRVIENAVFGFHAPSPFTYNGSIKKNGYSLFSDETWDKADINNFQNISDAALQNGNYYFGSIGDGLFDQSTGQIIVDIDGSSPELDTMIVALNADSRLWISSFNNTNPIHRLGTDQEWSSFSATDLLENQFTSIDLTVTGAVWLGGMSGSITAFDSDQGLVERISTADGLPSTFSDIALSVEDDGWVVTPKGPVLFTNASFVFDNSQAITPSFENRTLFENENVNAVMTDGGNRVWFGTDRGLWVFDENTTEQIALFNEMNSPLPSNKVLDLTYNQENGEVFINTDKGMVSFRSSSSEGSRQHQNVTIFPNPVRPDYSGLVGISGLAKNVSIKITDIQGNLVKEIDANGGTASWGLLDASNEKVVTGVYLFFSSSFDGTETFVGKIAVIR